MASFRSTAIVRRLLSSISRSPIAHPEVQSACQLLPRALLVMLTSSVPPNKDRVRFVIARWPNIPNRDLPARALHRDALVGHDVLRCCQSVRESKSTLVRVWQVSTNPVSTHDREGAPCNTRPWAPTRPLRASARTPTRTLREAGTAAAGWRPGWRRALQRAQGRGCSPWSVMALVFVRSAWRCQCGCFTPREQDPAGVALGVARVICRRASGRSASCAVSCVCHLIVTSQYIQ